MRWLIILLLTGCGSFQTLEQQYDEAVACEENCEHLWQAYERREKYAVKHAEPKCPDGLVMITDNRYATRLGKNYSCVTREEAYRILQRLSRSRL